LAEVIIGQLRMLGDRILLKPLEWDTNTTIHAIRHGRPVRGEVIAIGPGLHPVSKRTKLADGRQRIDFAKRFQATEAKPGDVVELGGLNIFDGKGYEFPEVIVNGVKHLIVTERDVCGIRSDSPDGR
jgi:co-chaperonin GroES (HSP10)